MQKKILISILLSISLILSLTFCFANNDINNKPETGKNIVQNAENTLGSGVQNAGNMAKDATNAVKNGAQNIGNSTKNALDAAGNAMENGVNNAKNTMSNTFGTNKRNDNYNVTRTSAESTFMGMTSNTWSWLILGIAAIAIIALVWYYSVQLNNNKHNDDNY